MTTYFFGSEQERIEYEKFMLFIEDAKFQLLNMLVIAWTLPVLVYGIPSLMQ